MYTFPPVLKQIYASSGTICLFLTQGYFLGLQSVMLPKLRDPSSGIKLDIHQESWIMAASIFTMFPTQLLCSYLTYKFGRKPVLYTSLMPCILSFILMYYSTDYPTILASFAMVGFNGGGISVGTMLVAECTSPKYRNVLLNAKALSSAIGTMAAHTLISFFDWRSICLYGLLPASLAFTAAITSPESPSWLASKGKFDQCRKAFEWLRGLEDQDELEKLIASRKDLLTKRRLALNWSKKKFKSIKKYLLNRGFLRSMTISLACILCIDVNGKTAFTQYVIDALSAILGNDKYAYYGSVGIDFIEVATLAVSCVSVKRFKQRTMLFQFGISGLVVLLIFCLLSYLFSNNLLPVNYRWVTLPLILIYFTLLNIGVIPTLLGILNEVVPLSHREIGLGVTSVLFVGFLFCSIKMTPYLMKNYELHGSFLINAAIISLSLLYLYYFLPETSSKTLHDIEMEIKGDRKKSDDSDNGDCKRELVVKAETYNLEVQ